MTTRPPNEALEEYPRPGDALRTATAPAPGAAAWGAAPQRGGDHDATRCGRTTSARWGTRRTRRGSGRRACGASSEQRRRRRSRAASGARAEAWIDTREMDRFAREATVFPRAYAGSFPTVPCRTDCFTGRHGVPGAGWSPLAAGRPVPGGGAAARGVPDAADLRPADAAALRVRVRPRLPGGALDPGQTSDGFVVDPTLDVQLEGPPEKWRGKGTAWLQHRRNAHYWASELDHFGPRTLFTGEQWLEKNYKHGPFFLWIDTWDPHEPWDAPQYYVDKYDPGYDGLVVNQPEYSPGDRLTTEECAPRARALRGRGDDGRPRAGPVLRQAGRPGAAPEHAGDPPLRPRPLPGGARPAGETDQRAARRSTRSWGGSR